MKTALVFGAAGQDGWLMCKFLLDKGYDVIGTYRPGGTIPMGLQLEGIRTIPYDITDSYDQLKRILVAFKPSEIYNLAGQTFQDASYPLQSYTYEANLIFVVRLLEAVRDIVPEAHVFQPSAAGMFGHIDHLCSERTPFSPVSPYDISKYAAHRHCDMMRFRHGLHVSCGILFSHESPRRGPEMVSRKISRAVALWAHGVTNFPLTLGNIEFSKDWGWAEDFVRAYWMMLQQKSPGDYVIGSGETHSVEEFLCAAVTHVFDRSLVGEMLAKVTHSNEFRRATTFQGYADTRLLKIITGWEHQTSFIDIVRKMVDSDLKSLRERNSADVSI